MSKYTLKSIAKRGTTLGAVVALVAATIVPAAAVFADALNPLTERSLLLSSSAPGYQDTDGSGNSETNPNAWNGGESYAPPGSGPNGKKTGETFTFNVSTNSVTSSTPIKAFSLQYCTTAAGECRAPGNNLTGETNAVAHAKATPTSDFDVVTDGTTPWAEGAGAGQFQVLMAGVPQTGWSMFTKNVEDYTGAGHKTGKNNFIYLTHDTGISPVFNDKMTIKFTPNSDNYITNPGLGSFFVKINTYKTDLEAGLLPTTSDNIIDGGVTVANVMTDSIHITTKVLETMSFSVGTENPDNINVVGTGTVSDPATWTKPHGTCEAINAANNNRLDLGNPQAESSLETGKAYDVHSFWRLSSNSSGGATVYYSGDTLRNTVGDHIRAIGTGETLSLPGTEQFGLGFVPIDPATQTSPTFKYLISQTGAGQINEANLWKNPSISPLVMNESYDEAAGLIGETGTPATAKFAFDENSQMTPAVIAENNDAVLSCATAQMRYVGNIAADTPAGIYTTKINYLAAPQY